MNVAPDTSSTIDITPAVRARRFCGIAGYPGYLIATFGILFALAIPPLWIAVVLLFAASLSLAAASRVGAVLHLLLSTSLLGFFIYDLHRFHENIATQTDLVMPREPAISWFWIGVFLVTLVLSVLGVIASVIYHRVMPSGHAESRSIRVFGRWLLKQALALRHSGIRRALALYLLVVLIGVLFLLPTLVGTGIIGDIPSRFWDTLSEHTWLYWVLLGAYAMSVGPVGWGIWFLLTRAKRLRAAGTAALLAVDPRAPVLFLRSFQDDLTPIQRRLPFTSYQPSSFYSRAWTLEEALERVLSSYGPVVAIGRPGEALPPAGAAREYIAGDQWKKRVAELIEQARLVVVIVGETEGLTYEYGVIQRFMALDRLLLVFPPVDSDAKIERWDRFCGVVDPRWTKLLPDQPEIVLMATFPQGETPEFSVCRWQDEEDCYRLAIRRQIEVTV